MRSALLCLLLSSCGPDRQPVGQSSIPQSPSCEAPALLCGAGADDCCQRLEVAGGSFYRDNQPEFPANISRFELDRYEVTVGRFRAFTKHFDTWRAAGHPTHGEGRHPQNGDAQWESAFDAWLAPSAAKLTVAIQSADCVPHEVTWTDAPGGTEDFPMNCVTWYEAYAFCIWDDARLATEAELTFAAAGGAEQRRYPWGEAEPEQNTDLAVYGCLYAGNAGCAREDIAKVGSAPAGLARFGHLDLAGSMREWVFDRYQDPYPAGPCDNCAHASRGDNRSFRGGSWYNGPISLSTVIRNNNLPTFRSDSLGFRCARDIALPRPHP